MPVSGFTPPTKPEGLNREGVTGMLINAVSSNGVKGSINEAYDVGRANHKFTLYTKY